MFTAIKSKIFSQVDKQEEPTEIDIEDNQSDVEDNDTDNESTGSALTEYVLGNPIYESQVFDGIGFKKFVTKASKFIPNVTGWAYNRKIDMSHSKKIQDDIIRMKHPHLIGSFKIVKPLDDTQPPKLLDGQHRKHALETLMRTYKNFDIDIDVDVYYVDDVEKSDKTIRELFVKANNNRNFEPGDIPEILVMLVVDKIIQRWPKSIKVDETKGANRPNITKKDLVSHLKPVLMDERFTSNDADKIFQKIEEINNEIRLMPLVELFGNRKPAERKLRCLAKANEMGFFLNMDCKRSIEVWTQELLK